MLPDHSGLIQELQSLTGLPVPADYLQLLASYPAALQNLPRAEDGSEKQGHVSCVELMCDQADVLDVNREVRSGPVMDPSGAEFEWPAQVLVIGENGGGDYYAIDVSAEHPGVLFFNHQAVEFQEITDSIVEYVELLISTFAP